MRFNYITLENCALARGTVVAIDVLRAFTTAAYAFESGAESISLVAGVEEALIMKAKHPGWLVMGEEGGLPPVGFDFGNSPTQIAKQELKGKQIIQRTGAGTQGVVRSVRATQLLAASFVVASATVRYVLERRPRVVTFVITGGEQNEEDLSCAEYLECLFRGWSPDPAPFIKRVFDSKDALFHLDPARSEFPYYDLEYCTHIDAFPFAMPVSRENDRLVLRPVIPAA